MSNRLTLEAIEVIDAIVSKGSFAAAAAALYKVPSAITYTVQKLEDDLGVVLFRKEGRKHQLTPAGVVLLNQGRELLDAAERLVESTRQVDSGWETCLNITLDTLVDVRQILPVLDQFYRLDADVELNLNHEVLGGTWEALVNDRADIILGGPDLPGKSNSVATAKLIDIHMVFVVSPAHPLCQIKGQVSDDDIRQHRAVIVKDSSQTMPPLTRQVFDKQSALRVSNLSDKIKVLKQGLGVGFVPKHRIQSELENKDLVMLDLVNPLAPAPIYYAWKKSNKGRALRWFVEAFEN